MKTKVLAVLLVTSVLINIAGLVVFIGMLTKLQGNYRNIKRERNIMAQNLNVVRASAVASDPVESGHVIHRTFISLADGQEDVYAWLPPRTPRLDNTLVVYLHGMGSNELEPFACPPDRTIAQAISDKYPEAALLSCSYRKSASWGSDAALSDISQNIRAVMQELPINHIVLMGTSMGGCTVLLYATQAPPDIKQKISGIVSVEGAGNLEDLYQRTQSAAVKNAIANMVGGDGGTLAQAYKHKSFLPNIEKLPRAVRVSVLSATNDGIVPPSLQQDLMHALNDRGNPTKLLTIDSGHGAPPASLYLEGFDYASAGLM